MKIFTALFIVLACSCHGKIAQPAADKILPYKTAKLGTSDLSISIPGDYTVKENQGPDFVVYDISPLDTTKNNFGNAGIYFGWYPSSYGRDNMNQKIDSTNAFLVGLKSNWTIYKTKTGFLAETIQSLGEYGKTHAFATATSRAHLDTMIHMFKSLQ